MQALTVVTGLLLSRALSPAHRGVLAEIMLIPSLAATVCSLGLFDALLFSASRDSARSDDIRATVEVLLILAAVPAVALSAVAGPILLNSRYRHLALAYCAYVPLLYLTLTAATTLQSQQRFNEYNNVRILIQALTTLGLLAGFAANAISIAYAVYTYLGAELLTATYACSRRGTLASSRYALRSYVRPLLSYGAKSQLSSMSALFNERADQLLIALLLKPGDLGLYITAVGLTAPVVLVGISLTSVALPSLAALHEAGQVQRVAGLLIGRVVALSTVFAGTLAFLSHWIIIYIFGARYSASIGLSYVLLGATVLLSLNRALAGILKARGLVGITGIAESVALLIALVCLLLGLPRFGLVAAAYASLVGYAAATCLLAAFVRRTIYRQRH